MSASAALSQTAPAEPPSDQSRTFQVGSLLSLSVPANWREFRANNSFIYAPEGGIRQVDGRNEVVRGIEVLLIEGEGRDLRTNTDAFVQGLTGSNPKLQALSTRQDTVGGLASLITFLNNVNNVTGQEEGVIVETAQVSGNRVLVLMATIPTTAVKTDVEAFRRVRQTLQISSATAAATPPDALVGSWVTQGLFLTLGADGSFSKVTHSSFGSFGGAFDDSGSYEVNGDEIVFHGIPLTRTCKFSIEQNTLVLCGVNYRRE